MLKKLIVTGAAAGLLLASAGGAFAWWFPSPTPAPTSANVNISNSGAVFQSVKTSANTGLNSQSAKGDVEFSSISTGAANAGANIAAQLNWNQFDCGCVLGLSDFDNVGLSIDNHGFVAQLVRTSANTGLNSQSAGWWGGDVDHSSITTGAAAASSVVTGIVNTNMFGGSE